jgi:ribosomal-protein-serine acetyltransferase
MLDQRIDEEIELLFLQRSLSAPLFALTRQHQAYLSRWLPWPPGIAAEEDTQTFIRRAVQQFAERRAMQCAVQYHGELVGICGFNTINHPLKRVQIGYWLAEPWQGRGIITRACRWLIAEAFSTWQMQKVEIAVAVENRASRAVCERLGMCQEAIRPQAEQLAHGVVDHVIYGLTVEAWRLHDA